MVGDAEWLAAGKAGVRKKSPRTTCGPASIPKTRINTRASKTPITPTLPSPSALNKPNSSFIEGAARFIVMSHVISTEPLPAHAKAPGRSGGLAKTTLTMTPLSGARIDPMMSSRRRGGAAWGATLLHRPQDQVWDGLETTMVLAASTYWYALRALKCANGPWLCESEP